MNDAGHGNILSMSPHTQERSHTILCSISRGFMFLDTSFRVQQINEEGVRIDGRPASELLGRSHWELWPGSEELELGRAYKRAMKEGIPVDFEQYYSHFGHDYWFDIQAYPASGGLAVFYRDISARKSQERALAERENMLRLAIDAADVGEWDVDMATQVMFWPARVKAMFGISADKPVTLEDYYDGIHPDDRASTLASFANTADPALRSQYVAEYRTIGKEDGVVRWVAAKGRGLFNEAGECTRIIGTITDITQRKATEEALRESEERLRHADRRKDEFLAMLAHELRNPLAPISAAAQLLQLGKLDDAQLRRSSQIISRQVGHMTSLVDDLLDVSRVTSGLITLDQELLDINTLIADAVEQVTPLVRARGQDLEILLTANPATVRGDRKRLVQVLTNVLNNAAKYTPERGSIRLRTSVHDERVRISVSDNGIGMAPELVARAFDLFVQAERSSDRTSGGLGLGLALVKSMIDLHQGTVTCESPGIGKGSTFVISLPAQDRTDRATPDSAVTPAALAGQAYSLRIMVVDDNIDAAAMLAMLLESSGHQVVVEHDAHSAIARARQSPPQVCLLDIGLPEMDGNALAQALKSHPDTRSAVLVAVTGYGQDKDRMQSASAGFAHHLVKPVDITRLNAILAGIDVI